MTRERYENFIGFLCGAVGMLIIKDIKPWWYSMICTFIVIYIIVSIGEYIYKKFNKGS